MEHLQNIDALITEYGYSIIMPWADESSPVAFGLGGMKPPRRITFKGSIKQANSLNVNYNEISTSLQRFGLTCSNNNPELIKANLRTVVEGLPTGTLLDTFVNSGNIASFGPTESPKPYQWQADGLSEFKSLLDIVMANIDKVKRDNLYYISSNRVENSFRSSTIGSIVNVFRAAGTIIGSVQGNNIDPAQLGAQIGDLLVNLSETTAANFNQTNNSNMTLIADPKTDADGNQTLRAVASVAWTYHFLINDYKDKKVNEHSSYYLITQNNVIFTDTNILEKVANKLQQGGG